MKVLFIHRSVGRDLLKRGELRGRLRPKGVYVDDYDNNTGMLTRDDLTPDSRVIEMPGDNTNPDNLADFFELWPDVLNRYDLVMTKSCYPNSHVKSEAHLNTIKDSYNRIFHAFNQHGRSILILTSPPLRPLFTNQAEAMFANKLADWLVGSAGANIHVFDLHHLYSEPTGRHEGMLRSDYRRWLPWDNHPNSKAHRSVAGQLVDEIERVLAETKSA